MGSHPVLAVAPQQGLREDFRRSADWPYFSLRTSLMSSMPALVVLMDCSPICKFERFVRASLPYCACSTRHRGIAAALAGRRYWRYIARTSLPAVFVPTLRSSVFRDGARASSLEFLLQPVCHLPHSVPDARTPPPASSEAQPPNPPPITHRHIHH